MKIYKEEPEEEDVTWCAECKEEPAHEIYCDDCDDTLCTTCCLTIEWEEEQ